MPIEDGVRTFSAKLFIILFNVHRRMLSIISVDFQCPCCPGHNNMQRRQLRVTANAIVFPFGGDFLCAFDTESNGIKCKNRQASNASKRDIFLLYCRDGERECVCM